MRGRWLRFTVHVDRHASALPPVRASRQHRVFLTPSEPFTWNRAVSPASCFSFNICSSSRALSLSLS